MSHIQRKQLTATKNIITTPTQPGSNGFHILWDVYDTSTSTIVSDVSAISLAIQVILPNGRTLDLDNSPYAASDFQVPPTAMGGGETIKITASGLTGTKVVNINIVSLF